MSMKKIRFVDNGQDFLEWIIKDGKVISCKPYQAKSFHVNHIKSVSGLV
jgi:hypothetical protein